MVTKIVTAWSRYVWNGILPQHTLSFVLYARAFAARNTYMLGILVIKKVVYCVLKKVARLCTYFSSGQGSRGCQPSSMEYSRSSTPAGQNHEGQSYQTWHSPSK